MLNLFEILKKRYPYDTKTMCADWCWVGRNCHTLTFFVDGTGSRLDYTEPAIEEEDDETENDGRDTSSDITTPFTWRIEEGTVVITR